MAAVPTAAAMSATATADATTAGGASGTSSGLGATVAALLPGFARLFADLSVPMPTGDDVVPEAALLRWLAPLTQEYVGRGAVAAAYRSVHALERRARAGDGITLQGLIATLCKVATDAFASPTWHATFPEPEHKLRLLLFLADGGQRYFKHPPMMVGHATSGRRGGGDTARSVGSGAAAAPSSPRSRSRDVLQLVRAAEAAEAGADLRTASARAPAPAATALQPSHHRSHPTHIDVDAMSSRSASTRGTGVVDGDRSLLAAATVRSSRVGMVTVSGLRGLPATARTRRAEDAHEQLRTAFGGLQTRSSALSPRGSEALAATQPQPFADAAPVAATTMAPMPSTLQRPGLAAASQPPASAASYDEVRRISSPGYASGLGAAVVGLPVATVEEVPLPPTPSAAGGTPAPTSVSSIHSRLSRVSLWSQVQSAADEHVRRLVLKLPSPHGPAPATTAAATAPQLPVSPPAPPPDSLRHATSPFMRGLQAAAAAAATTVQPATLVHQIRTTEQSEASAALLQRSHHHAAMAAITGDGADALAALHPPRSRSRSRGTRSRRGSRGTAGAGAGARPRSSSRASCSTAGGSTWATAISRRDSADGDGLDALEGSAGAGIPAAVAAVTPSATLARAMRIPASPSPPPLHERALTHGTRGRGGSPPAVVEAALRAAAGSLPADDAAAAPPVPPPQQSHGLPSWTLRRRHVERAQTLPADTTEAALEALFRRYSMYGDRRAVAEEARRLAGPDAASVTSGESGASAVAAIEACRMSATQLAKLCADAGVLGRGGHGGGSISRGDVDVAYKSALSRMCGAGTQPAKVALWKSNSYTVREVTRSMLHLGLDYAAFSHCLLLLAARRWMSPAAVFAMAPTTTGKGVADVEAHAAAVAAAAASSRTSAVAEAAGRAIRVSEVARAVAKSRAEVAAMHMAREEERAAAAGTDGDGGGDPVAADDVTPALALRLMLSRHLLPLAARLGIALVSLPPATPALAPAPAPTRRAAPTTAAAATTTESHAVHAVPVMGDDAASTTPMPPLRALPASPALSISSRPHGDAAGAGAGAGAGGLPASDGDVSMAASRMDVSGAASTVSEASHLPPPAHSQTLASSTLLLPSSPGPSSAISFAAYSIHRALARISMRGAMLLSSSSASYAYGGRTEGEAAGAGASSLRLSASVPYEAASAGDADATAASHSLALSQTRDEHDDGDDGLTAMAGSGTVDVATLLRRTYAATTYLGAAEKRRAATGSMSPSRVHGVLSPPMTNYGGLGGSSGASARGRSPPRIDVAAAVADPAYARATLSSRAHVADLWTNDHVQTREPLVSPRPPSAINAPPRSPSAPATRSERLVSPGTAGSTAAATAAHESPARLMRAADIVAAATVAGAPAPPPHASNTSELVPIDTVFTGGGIAARMAATGQAGTVAGHRRSSTDSGGPTNGVQEDVHRASHPAPHSSRGSSLPRNLRPLHEGTTSRFLVFSQADLLPRRRYAGDPPPHHAAVTAPALGGGEGEVSVDGDADGATDRSAGDGANAYIDVDGATGGGSGGGEWAAAVDNVDAAARGHDDDAVGMVSVMGAWRSAVSAVDDAVRAAEAASTSLLRLPVVPRPAPATAGVYHLPGRGGSISRGASLPPASAPAPGVIDVDAVGISEGAQAPPVRFVDVDGGIVVIGDGHAAAAAATVTSAAAEAAARGLATPEGATPSFVRTRGDGDGGATPSAAAAVQDADSSTAASPPPHAHSLQQAAPMTDMIQRQWQRQFAAVTPSPLLAPRGLAGEASPDTDGDSGRSSAAAAAFATPEGPILGDAAAISQAAGGHGLPAEAAAATAAGALEASAQLYSLDSSMLSLLSEMHGAAGRALVDADAEYEYVRGSQIDALASPGALIAVPKRKSTGGGSGSDAAALPLAFPAPASLQPDAAHAASAAGASAASMSEVEAGGMSSAATEAVRRRRLRSPQAAHLAAAPTPRFVDADWEGGGDSGGGADVAMSFAPQPARGSGGTQRSAPHHYGGSQQPHMRALGDGDRAAMALVHALPTQSPARLTRWERLQVATATAAATTMPVPGLPSLPTPAPEPAPTSLPSLQTLLALYTGSTTAATAMPIATHTSSPDAIAVSAPSTSSTPRAGLLLPSSQPTSDVRAPTTRGLTYSHGSSGGGVDAVDSSPTALFPLPRLSSALYVPAPLPSSVATSAAHSPNTDGAACSLGSTPLPSPPPAATEGSVADAAAAVISPFAAIAASPLSGEGSAAIAAPAEAGGGWARAHGAGVAPPSAMARSIAALRREADAMRYHRSDGLVVMSAVRGGGGGDGGGATTGHDVVPVDEEAAAVVAPAAGAEASESTGVGESGGVAAADGADDAAVTEHNTRRRIKL